MNVTDELQRLQELHSSGTLDDDEFAQAKARLLSDAPPVPPIPTFAPGVDLATLEQETKMWA